MDKTNRPLWQLLLLTRDSKKSAQLTCEECIALLEYDAELLINGADLDDVRPAVSYHLSLCSECQAKIDEWLGRLDVAQAHLYSH
jgi:hypothetical protein